MAIELRRVETLREWEAYHSLRESVLWAGRTDLPPYDREHPHESADGNHPLLLFVDDEPAGAIRVDVRAPVAWFRLIAIRDDLQGRGHGRRLLDLAAEFARASGCTSVRCNVEVDSLPFYERIGFQSTGESPVALHMPI